MEWTKLEVFNGDGDLLIDQYNNRFEVVWDSVNAKWDAKKDG